MTADRQEQGQYWSLRVGGEEDTGAILRLVRNVHGDAYLDLDESYWAWRYLSDTPFRARIVIAEHEGRPIGIQPMIIFDWQWGRCRYKGAMYTGVMTHPDHRRRGVFHSLVGAANDCAAKSGAHFSMTLPNEASLPGFLKTRQWRYPGLASMFLKMVDGEALLRPKLGSLPAKLLGLIPQAFFRPRPVGRDDVRLDVTEAKTVPDELETVFDDYAAACNALMIRRTARFWNWRYGAHPRSIYRTWLATREGHLAGAVATSTGERAGLDVGMIVDLVARGGMPVIRGLLRAAEAGLRSRGVGLIACQATSGPLKAALREEGFRCPGPWLTRKRFHFVFRPTGVAVPRELPKAMADWHLMLGDSDNV